MGVTIGQEPAQPARPGEKRQLAVFFADLADSTSLCAAIGAEQFHALAFDFLQRSAALVEANGGYVARFMGDGLLAYFGYPAAAEDDSVRAIRTAIAVRDLVAELAGAAELSMGVRTGIATGTVILGQWLGTGPAGERPIVGDTANLAARLQTAAQPNSILVAETTYQLARSAFRFEERNDLVLKGIATGTRAYEVAGTLGWDHRPWICEGGRHSMIGRLPEIEILRRNLAEARNGAVRQLIVTGEAGIGKSTLVAAFASDLDPADCRLVAGAANPGFANLPFFLARQFFVDDVFAAEDRSPTNGQAESVIEQAVGQLLAQPGRGPLVVIAEDIHWIDPSSAAFLGALARVARTGLLLISTSRAPLPSAPTEAGNRLELQRLEEPEMAALIRRVAPAALAPATVRKIVDRAGGVPLFGAELARQGPGKIVPDDHPLPWTLSELLASRLAGLGESLRLAQCLAVLGLSAETALLAELSELAPQEFSAAASALTAANIISIDRDGLASRTRFSHALIQETVYHMLLAADRKILHRRAAEAIEALGTAQDLLDDLGRHWTACGEFAHAASIYAAAGEAHRLRYGHLESERAAELGLAALKRIGPSPLRDRIELDLQSTLASVLQIRAGYSNHRARAAADRAKTLAERHGELTQRFGGVAGQWMSASSAGDYASAAIAAQQLLAIATSVGGRELLAAAWMAQLTSRFRMGDIAGAEQAFLSGESYYGVPAFTARPGGIAQTYGNAALVAVLLGDPAEARSRAALALRNGRRMRSDYDICFAAYMAGMLCILLGADRMARRWGERSLRLATRIGFPQFSAIAQVVLGRATAGLGETVQGLEMIRSGIAAMDATGSRVGLTLYLSWLAEAECFAGRAEEAALTLERALAANPEERFYLPETLRLKAQLLSASNRRDERLALLNQSQNLAIAAGGRWFLQRLEICDRGASRDEEG
jgi:class 3 adenylate cyclase/tetratricopeptide (TPR) repeat protein